MGRLIKSGFHLGVLKSTRALGERVSAGDPSPGEQGLYLDLLSERGRAYSSLLKGATGRGLPGMVVVKPSQGTMLAWE